jgi:hypothetical protein
LEHEVVGKLVDIAFNCLIENLCLDAIDARQVPRQDDPLPPNRRDRVFDGRKLPVFPGPFCPDAFAMSGIAPTPEVLFANCRILMPTVFFARNAKSGFI